MSILITGAAGFIGLNVVAQLLAQGHAVVAHSLGPLPDAARAAFARLPGSLALVTGDVRDVDALRDAVVRHGVARVLHTAALTVGPATNGAAAVPALSVNIAGTSGVLQVARETGVRRVVFTSSTAVYGDAPFAQTPLTEETPVTPVTVYGYTKVAAEALVAQARVFGLDTVCARLTAIYGPWEHDSGVRDTLSPPFQVARAALRGESVILAEGGLRDWTSSTAVADALIRLLLAPGHRHDVYNLGVGRTWHPSALCEALAARLPGFGWRLAQPGEVPSVAYNDDLQRPRVSPPAPTRFEAEFGAVFGQPQSAVQAYADWVVDHGRALLC